MSVTGQTDVCAEVMYVIILHGKTAPSISELAPFIQFLTLTPLKDELFKCFQNFPR